MIGISSREQKLIGKEEGKVSRVRPLRQGICDEEQIRLITALP